MTDIDQSNLRRFIERVVRRLLNERPDASRKRTQPQREPFVVEVLDLRTGGVAPELTDGTDEHDRWFRRL